MQHFRLRGFGHGIFRGEHFKDAFGGGAGLDDLILQSRQIFQRLIDGDDGNQELNEIRGLGCAGKLDQM